MLEAAHAAGAQGPRLLVLVAPDAQAQALVLADGRRIDRLPGESQDQLIKRAGALLGPGAPPVIAAAVYGPLQDRSKAQRAPAIGSRSP